MKKAVIVALILFFSYNAHSQSYMGIKGSFHISTLTTGGAKSRPGFDIGAIYSTPVSDNWYLQPNILFSFNSTKSSGNYSPDYSAYSYSVQTPLLLSYRIGDEQVSFGFDMGVFARYGLFGGYWTDTENGRIKPDIFDYQKRFDAGPQIGLSIIINNIYMGSAIQYGLIKPWDNIRGHYLEYSLSFGYLFEL